MTSPSLARVSWPNQNSLRRYPLSATSNGRSRDDVFEIPSATFVDAKISTYWESNLHVAGFYIAKLTFSRTAFRVDIGHISLSEFVGVVVGSISGKENVAHAISGSGPLSGSRGTLVTGDLKYLLELTPGTYNFDHVNAAFDPGVVYAQPRTLRSLILESGGGETEEITGDIRLRPASGTQFRVVQENEETIIIWDAVGSTDLQEECPCENSSQRPVLTVGGLPPNESGAIELFGSRCLEVTAAAAGLQLANPCSEPCCDCQEDTGLDLRMDMLYQQVNAVEARIAALENAYTNLAGLTPENLSCDEVRCQPYDPEISGSMISDFRLNDPGA